MKTKTEFSRQQQALIDCLILSGGFDYDASKKPEKRTNPYTGKTVELEPIAVALYDWIVSPDRGDNIESGKENKRTWNRVRYMFATLWPDAYYDLID